MSCWMTSAARSASAVVTSRCVQAPQHLGVAIADQDAGRGKPFRDIGGGAECGIDIEPDEVGLHFRRIEAQQSRRVWATADAISFALR